MRHGSAHPTPDLATAAAFPRRFTIRWRLVAWHGTRLSDQRGGVTLRVALPIHRGRISPLYDTAVEAVVVDIDGVSTGSSELSLPGDGALGQVQALVSANVEGLVCGAISDGLMSWLLRRKLQVWPGVAGEVDVVIAGLLADGSLNASFMMPGCGSRGRRAGSSGRWRWGWHSAGDPRGGPRSSKRPRCRDGHRRQRRT
jgi:hypothetical protein